MLAMTSTAATSVAAFAAVAAVVLTSIPGALAADETYGAVKTYSTMFEVVRVGRGNPIAACGLNYAYKVEYYYPIGCLPTVSQATTYHYTYDADSNVKTVYTDSDCSTSVAATTISTECVTVTHFTRSYVQGALTTASTTAASTVASPVDYNALFVSAAFEGFAQDTTFEDSGVNTFHVGAEGYITSVSNITDVLDASAQAIYMVGYDSVSNMSCTSVTFANDSAVYYIGYSATGNTGYYIAYTDSKCTSSAVSTLDTIYTTDVTAGVISTVTELSTFMTETLTGSSTITTYGEAVAKILTHTVLGRLQINAAQSLVTTTTTTPITQTTSKRTTTSATATTASTATKTGNGAAPTGISGAFPYIAAGIVAGGVLLI